MSLLPTLQEKRKQRNPKMNNMSPSKRAANRAATCSKDRERLGEKWQQPRGPCPCTNFQQLPRAIAMEILSMLSMKTLLNCRCVCKEWLSLISDPQFTHPHLSRSRIGILIKKYPHNLKSWKPELTHVEECAESDSWVDTMNFIDNVPISEFGLVNSCNGLVCLSGPHKYDPCYVCNPILGEFIIIPPTQKGRGWCSFVGFGFSVRTNEYKVLQTSLSDNFCEAEAEIYTIGTGLWRSIGNAPMDFPELPFNSYLRGALHWVSYGGNMSMLINTFNYGTEQFQRLPSPCCFGQRKKQSSESFKLGVLGGCLLLSVFDDESSKIGMWVMKDYGVQESWTKFLVIVENLFRRTPFLSLHEPIMFLSNGEILMVHNNWDVVCYNKEKKSFREIRLTGTQSSFSFNAISYSPSFVSLYDVSRGEEVKRVRAGNKSDKLRAVGSSDCVGSGMPPYKNTKLN
ncbi:PREDICTED: F-box [Prunus dulcis]|uniref:PREDICTED: F-box n=2 Tax=Prunus dulcis TaxID=3755 RepID=A0A5E4FN99_PRUDU|nr:F-box protein At3g07870-like [Prunus dulcis]KAI5349655.1 hypothetical protein L3X38_002544 [Prunus dulcis]VVA28934.1 PREDICTED: F-box [Prunus dulcis]